MTHKFLMTHNLSLNNEPRQSVPLTADDSSNRSWRMKIPIKPFVVENELNEDFNDITSSKESQESGEDLMSKRNAEKIPLLNLSPVDEPNHETSFGEESFGRPSPVSWFDNVENIPSNATLPKEKSPSNIQSSWLEIIDKSRHVCVSQNITEGGGVKDFLKPTKCNFVIFQLQI